MRFIKTFTVTYSRCNRITTHILSIHETVYREMTKKYEKKNQIEFNVSLYDTKQEDLLQPEKMSIQVKRKNNIKTFNPN